MGPVKRKTDDTQPEVKPKIPKDDLQTKNDEKRIIKPEDISIGRFVNGRTDIYPVWQSLLEKWFKESATEVYIVTPFMDIERLLEICFFMLDHQATANLKAIYVRELGNVRVPKLNPPKFIPYWKFKPGQPRDDPEAYADLTNVIVKAFSPQYRNYVKDHVISKLINPKSTFHGKFAAGVNAKGAQVLITSANFQTNHFDFNNYETVCYSTMSKSEFDDRFLSSIDI